MRFLRKWITFILRLWRFVILKNFNISSLQPILIVYENEKAKIKNKINFLFTSFKMLHNKRNFNNEYLSSKSVMKFDIRHSLYNINEEKELMSSDGNHVFPLITVLPCFGSEKTFNHYIFD